MTHLPEEHVKRRLRVIRRKYLRYGYDITKDWIEVRPRPHYHCGGLVISARAETRVSGLYGAGAVTAGVHGANRLGANALVDILVFGEIAGHNAAEYAKGLAAPIPMLESAANDFLSWIAGLFDTSTTSHPIPNAALRRRHIELMDEHMGILRQESGMRAVLGEIDRAWAEDVPRLRVFDSSRAYNYELRDVLEIFYRLEVEEMATRAALERKESRGTHYRDDFPNRRDDIWLKNIVFWRDGENGTLRMRTKDVEQTLFRLADLREYASQNTPWH